MKTVEVTIKMEIPEDATQDELMDVEEIKTQIKSGLADEIFNKGSKVKFSLSVKEYEN